MPRTVPAMSRTTRELACQPKGQAGFTLVELMVAMVVLAVGLGALAPLFISATLSNNKNSRNATATMLAQLVLEQISSQSPNSTATIYLTDCAGNTWAIATTGGAAPTGAGALLDTTSTDYSYGGINPTQTFSAIPPATATVPGYAMQYADCGLGGAVSNYDVRWNVINIDTYTRLITVSARQVSPANQLGGRVYSLPVTVRGIGGS
jgi:prepilin-type N-terminal cleavage/methylation domain-containing protein